MANLSDDGEDDGGEGDGDVGLRPHVQWLHLDVRRVVQEAQARKVLAAFACTQKK